MQLSDEDREQLAKTGYVAMLDCLRRQQGKPDALIAPWQMVNPNTQDGMIAFAEAVASALLPAGTVAILASELRVIVEGMRYNGPAHDNEHMVVADELIDRLERLVDPPPEGV